MTNQPSGVSEGRIVHFVLDREESVGGTNAFRHVAAAIVRVWNPSYVNLLLLPDGSNDGFPSNAGFVELPWRTSVTYDEDAKLPGTWHFPERVP